jgi:hypothetical protein
MSYAYLLRKNATNDFEVLPLGIKNAKFLSGCETVT